MRIIDFLSQSPNNFIFQSRTNHTNWGGACSLIYGILILFIMVIYIIDYSLSDTYEIEYSFFDGFISSDSAKNSLLKNDSDYWPNLYFSFEIYGSDNKPLNDSYILLIDSKKVERNFTWIKINISNFDIAVLVKCEDIMCYAKNITEEYYYIIMRHSYFVLDHQNKSLPIYMENKYYIQRRFDFSHIYWKNIEFEWNVIKYKKDKGISLLIDKIQKKSDEYVGGYLNYYNSYYIYSNGSATYFDCSDEYRLLASIENKGFGDRIVVYKRNKKQIFDLIASIGALCSTFFTIFSTVFNYYSKNFDNYKILGKILNSPKEPIKKIELSSNFNIEEEKDNKIKDLIKKIH